MNSYILYIGTIDKKDEIHCVKLKPGVNIITGKSSTGKSALLEIFDYCFGSSDYTVPVGVITETTSLFFSIIKVNNSILVLARKPNSTHVFLREELNATYFENALSLNLSYFNNEEFVPLREFLTKLKRYFGVTVTDIDEDLEDRKWRPKSSTPSARSFTSYMLQHQNLIANKHAVFYRFEQKEKREQAIQHLRIFLGFVNQQYYTKSQELNALIKELNKEERLIPRTAELLSTNKKDLFNALKIYSAISGHELPIDIESATSNPSSTLSLLKKIKIKPKDDQNEYVKLKQTAENDKRIIIAELRKLQLKLAEIQSSIDFSVQYTERNKDIFIPDSVELHVSKCPFCESENNEVEIQANQLSEAIHWLNNELSHSSLRLESFEEEKSKIQSKILDKKNILADINGRISALERQTKDLETFRTQYEVTVEARLRIESVLLDMELNKKKIKNINIEKIKNDIKKIKKELSDNYNIEHDLNMANVRINQLLSKYGELFDFEKTYNPINLKFSLETFDLWHQPDKSTQKVFLRSMGSGANWLSCHIALFLSLHRYFCELGKECSIPSVMFFDQPSQVYFPSILDNQNDFSAKDIADKDISRNSNRGFDEDINAVTNLYEQLIIFCKETAEETGIMPQIIITDHADKLQFNNEITNGVTFESLVRNRWRGEKSGFINLS